MSTSCSSTKLAIVGCLLPFRGVGFLAPALRLLPVSSDEEKFRVYKARTQHLVEQYGGLGGIKGA